jgi:hypothetical protein
MYYDGSEPWFKNAPSADCANVMQSHLKQIALYDKDTQYCHAEWYRIKDGSCHNTAICFDEVRRDEPSAAADPVSQCEAAIKDYRQAQKKMKDAAQKVVESIKNL